MRALLVLALALALFSAALARAASKPLPAPKADFAASGQPVKTKYFTAPMPKGWVMPEKIKSRPGGLSCVFLDRKSVNTVNLTIMDIPLKSEEFAKGVAQTMKKSGLKIGQLEKIGPLYRAPVNDKAKGEAWFACDGKTCAATVILGEKIDKNAVNAFLSAFKPASPGIYPKKMK